MKQSNAKLQRELRERLQFETLLTDISARFVNIPSEQIDGTIEDAQQRVCECLGMDASSLWQWAEESPRFFSLTHLYVPPEGPEIPESIDGAEAFPWILRKIRAGETLVINTEKLPPAAERDKESRRSLGVKSSVVIPISYGGRAVIGTLSFDDLKSERDWPEEIVKRLTLVAQIFSNALARKRADEQLLESELRLNMAADSAEIGLWELDITTNIFWASERAREIFGYRPDEVISLERFESSVHPDDLKLVRNVMDRALGDGESIYVEYRVRVGDNGLKWIQSCGKPFFNSPGEPVRLLGASIDISESKDMQEALNAHLQEIEKLKLQLESENLILREDLKLEKGFGQIVGNSKALQSVLIAARQVASTDATVIILGESGTGKGLLASAIHQLGDRKNRPLVTVNCSALPRDLLESELFGREKGAFTGAYARQAGRFEVADGGTIFLDEIGEIPLDLQPKLLRVLQEGEFERLGSAKTVKVDVRVIAATSRDLQQEVREKRFREDLYYRVNVFPISIPPLRQRLEDIPLLVDYFLDKFNQKMGKQIEFIPKPVIEKLMQYDWPGNIRELEHVLERGVIISSGQSLTLASQLKACMAVDSQEPLKSLD
ncbi:MAG: sigma 54-interacting transcriptional regulator, partial [Desulfobacteraceae bacterium]|nr:sigma 54-interacting transcriptional regulator [Desulfobacteraceae bacterium]